MVVCLTPYPTQKNCVSLLMCTPRKCGKDGSIRVAISSAKSRKGSSGLLDSRTPPPPPFMPATQIARRPGDAGFTSNLGPSIRSSATLTLAHVPVHPVLRMGEGGQSGDFAAVATGATLVTPNLEKLGLLGTTILSIPAEHTSYTH